MTQSDLSLSSSYRGLPEKQTSTLFLYGVIAALTIGVSLSDFLTPLGVAVWVVYIAPISLSLWTWRPVVPIFTASIITAFMIISFFTDATGIDRDVAEINRGLGIFAIWSMAIVGYFFIRNKIAVATQEWLQNGHAALNLEVAGDQTIQSLSENILGFLARYLGAQAGVLFIQETGGALYARTATYGVPTGGALTSFGQGDSLLWQAARENRALLIEDVPDGYLTLGSALGKASPRHLIIAPGTADNKVNAVIELGFLEPVQDSTLKFLARIAESIGIAVRSAHYRFNLQNLLEETQRQAEELQAQGEELRVSNEELEEQSRALQESQARMEEQQAELEQINSQLEEQAELLEAQRDNLSEAQQAVETRSRELEQASQYKSEFLANMSHELRTPLNSSLILAKLLADNTDGNLSDEQVKYAETIQSSGNDLLSLINDILDLSKIEAGHMEIRPERIRIDKLVSDVARGFEVQAQQKELGFITEIASDCPEFIETDSKRLEQVLKNLLSNAFKFTGRGSVTLTVSHTKGGDINFSVIDTGIGIAKNHHAVIFEAFRQADSTTSRKYGGTGLGLSISRELTRLLGGEINLESEPGKGSVFTITLPEIYNFTHISSLPDRTPLLYRSAEEEVAAVIPQANKAPFPVQRSMDDDSGRLVPGKHTILVVEDDAAFAEILYDLCHELGLQCLLTNTTEEAFQVAAQYMPSAVILDVGLPDHSGLSVLDRMKQDSRMRHIPVHVISAGDYSQTAFSLGAAGYMLKPVKREELSVALKQMESNFVQHIRRILIVEDDPVQLDSVQKLLGLQNVETVGVSTAAACLDLLRQQTFDCMVLDLSLPDTSGYSLLETLSREVGYSFPPVIVYTGRELSSNQEQQLRRYSKSIIIKGAKSPERLLDEVTLFLHHVVAELPPEQQKMLKMARNRDAVLEGRRILIVEDDVRNVYSLTSILEPRGAVVQIARNGREALQALEKVQNNSAAAIDMILMDVMMPEMDGITATMQIRTRPEWRKMPIIMLTAKAMKDDQERCIEAGANDYMAKPLDVEKLLSLIRVWMPR